MVFKPIRTTTMARFSPDIRRVQKSVDGPEVGVAVFSPIRNRRVRTEKLQMSVPEPDMADRIPPIMPVSTNIPNLCRNN